jgi:hypothetical protein
MAFIPILLVAALVYFLFIRPIQRRSSATGQGFIASISPTYFIVLGLIAIGYGVAWRFASNDPGMLRMSGIDSQSAHSSLDALSIGALIIGGILFAMGIFKGSKTATPTDTSKGGDSID